MHANPDDTMTLAVGKDEVARLLGVHEDTIDNLRKAGRFGPQPVRLGRRVLFRRAEIVSWLAAGCPSAERWASMTAKGGNR